LGSIDISGAARTELLAEYSPEDSNIRALAQVKSNVGIYGPTLGFTIEKGQDGKAVFTWTEELPFTAEELLDSEKGQKKLGAQATAKAFLEQMLAHGARPEKEVEAQVKQAGISTTTLNRAKKALGVMSQPVYMEGKIAWWEWYLPGKQETTSPGEQGCQGGKVTKGAYINLDNVDHVEGEQGGQAYQHGQGSQHSQGDQHGHNNLDGQQYIYNYSSAAGKCSTGHHAGGVASPAGSHIDEENMLDYTEKL
jgi:hypothetical protein